MGDVRHEAREIRESDQPASKLVEIARRRTREQDLDALIVFTGPEGLGKSTCAWVVLSAIDPSFNGDRVAWTPKRFLELASEVEPGQAILFDEVVQGMHNRSSMSKDNKSMVEFLHICRAWNRVMGVCYPRFDGLDVVIREHRAWAWVRVLSQGRAEIRMRNHNIPVGDTETDALEAYPKVGGLKWDKVDSSDWKRAQARKDRFLHRFVLERLEQGKA